MMKEHWKYMLQSMRDDLAIVRRKGFPLATEVQCCCRICEKYWWHLRNEMEGYRFGDAREEIFFFREVKPKFTAEIEYYKLLYYSEEFRPDGHVSVQRDFWCRELGRWEQF